MKTNHAWKILSVAVFVGIMICLSGSAVAGQSIPDGAGTPLHGHQSIESKAALAKADDPDSVGALADEIFSFPRPYMRLPADIEAKLKTRIVKAELAFMQGTAPGVQEGDISNLINLIAQTLGAPDYAMTSPAQLRHLRMSLAIAEPKFIGKGLGHHEHIGDSISPTLSPLQAMHLILSLFDQKLINPEFQLSPADWQTKHQGLEADNVGKAGATIQQNPKRHEIEAILSQNIAAMNPGDAQRIIDESFFALGIH